MPHLVELIVSGVGSDRCLPLRWRPLDTIGYVKALASEELEVVFTHLTFAGQQLQDERTLSDYNIEPEDVVYAWPEPSRKGNCKGKGKGKDKGKDKGNVLRRPASRPTSA